MLVREPGGRFREARRIPLGCCGGPWRRPRPRPRRPRFHATATPTATATATATPTATASPTATPTPTPTATATPTPTATPAADRAETLAEDAGAGRVTDAAYEDGGELQAFFGLVGRAVEDTVLHYDDPTRRRGRASRSVLPALDAFSILAIDAAGTDAWLLGANQDGTLLLFQRASARWEPRPLTLPAGVLPLPASADPLTVTADGEWIDAALPGATDATFFRASDGTLTSWCDSGCDHPFGARFSRGQGYRWIGFAGGGRVISNPLPPGGGDEDNRGAYLVRRGDAFVRMPGSGAPFRPSAAFRSPTEGWLEGPVQVSAQPRPDHLREWPAAVRAPLTAAVTAPGQPSGSLDASALAVGQDGGVLRYTPGAGWTQEFLLSASGAVSKPLLRGVAWPEPGRAHAVGDLGAMWMWRAETGLWERDPAAPVGFEGAT